MKNPFWLRLFFLFVLLQALFVASALVRPNLISLFLPWEASPLNARFIAALYAMGAISALLCMVARRYAEVRILLVGMGLVTGLLLLITVPHFGEFTADNFPYRWTIFYIIDPLAAGLSLWWLRGRDPVPAGRNRLAPLFRAYAVVLTIAGIVLLVLPGLAVALWPWTLPPVLGQVYSGFFLTFAVAAVLAWREPRWEGVWIYLAANLGMFGLILLVSVLHSSRFKPGPVTWLWYGLWLAGVIAFSVPLWRNFRPFSTPEAVS
jgi:hypothetical protein